VTSGVAAAVSADTASCRYGLPVSVALYLMGSSSISVQTCAAFGGQDAELTTLSALRAQALRGRHGVGQKLLI
jgi:hypothetical protein